MPESLPKIPTNLNAVEATPNLEREREITKFLDSNRAIFAVLSKDTKISVSFTDDPSVTGYMQPATKSIVLGTAWMAKTGLDNTQALFVPVHEFGHADNMMEEGVKYIQSFETLRQYAQPVKGWFAAQIEARGKVLSVNQRANLENYIDKKYFEFWNIIDDIAINRWSTNQVPKLSRENTLEKLYKDHLFAEDTVTKSANYTDLPLHTQYQYYLLREAMVSESTSPTIITPEILQLINEAKHSTLFSPTTISIKEIVSHSTNKTRMTAADGSKINRIMRYSDRLDITLAFIAPNFDALLQKDFENLLQEFDKNEENDGQDSNQSNSGHENANSEGDQKSKNEGSSTSSKPQTLDEFLESLENQTSSKDTTFFDNEDPNSKALPSAFKPETPEDLQKIKEKVQEILEKIEQDNKKQTPVEIQSKEFLDANPEITPEQYQAYQQIKESVAKYSKELAQFWGELIGRQREQRKIGTHLAESGAKMNMNAVIRNYDRLSRGAPAKIFDKTIRGFDEGNEKPREVRFRIVLDRSGSMEGRKSLVLKQMYTVLMESFQNYRLRAKLSGAIKEGTFIDFRTECWGYGDKVQQMKPLSNPMEMDEQSAIIKSFGQIKADLGGNADEIMVATLDEKIAHDKQTNSKSSKKALDVIFYFTDGSPSNAHALSESLNSVDSDSVLWRAFQIEADSIEFDEVWNAQPNMRGMPVSLETMIPVVVEQLKEIINKL
jgi:hypothetical protein